jgi:Holliday junction DNA helicase RuvA
MLTKVFGIGKKSAERLVVELRDKLVAEAATRGIVSIAGGETDAEVVEALMALGYRADEARGALKDASGVTVPQRLASALKYLGAAKHA